MDKIRIHFIRTSRHTKSTEYSHSLINWMEELGLLDDVVWDYDPGPEGPIVENREHYVQVAWGIMERVKEAGKSGKYDAIVIQGFMDPVLIPAREVSPIPVLGCGQSAMHMASLICNKFSIIDTLEAMVFHIRENARLYGLEQKLASIRSIETPVPKVQFKSDPEEHYERIYTQCVRALEIDGADTLIFGCTSLSWMIPEIRKRLKERKNYDVPIIFPMGSAVMFAKFMVRMGFRHSPLIFPSIEPRDMDLVLPR